MKTLVLTVLACPDEAVGDVRRVVGQNVTLGRGNESDWRLADPSKSLSRRHCELEFSAGTWGIKDLSRNGTFLNREDLAIGPGEVRPVCSGDLLRLGEYQIQVTIDEEASSTPSQKRGLIPDDWYLAHQPPPVSEEAFEPDASAETVDFSVDVAPEVDRGDRPLLLAAIAGIRALLIGRAVFKREFRIDQTSLASERNNPLKFAATDEQALEALVKSATGQQAIQETINDLASHQVAVMAATQAAARALLAQLDPGKLEDEDVGGKMIPGTAEKRLWAAYKRQHARLVEQFDDDFESAFGKAFTRAYEAALGRARRTRSRGD